MPPPPLDAAAVNAFAVSVDDRLVAMLPFCESEPGVYSVYDLHIFVAFTCERRRAEVAAPQPQARVSGAIRCPQRDASRRVRDES